MFAGAQPVGDSGLYRCLDRAGSVVGGNIDVNVGACVRETETDGDRLRKRLASNLGDHFGLVNESGVKEEHGIARQVRAVPPRPCRSGRPVCTHRCLSDYRTRRGATWTQHKLIGGIDTAIAHSATPT